MCPRYPSVNFTVSSLATYGKKRDGCRDKPPWTAESWRSAVDWIVDLDYLGSSEA
jgi:hypothetical protein